MLYTLVVHRNVTEGQKWCDQLKKKGYLVLSVCRDFSAMVDMLMRKKVHIVFCSEDLAVGSSVTALKASAEFFPRIKIVVVGAVQKAFILQNLPNVSIVKSIVTAAENHCKPTVLQPTDSTDAETNEEGNLRRLLDDHYFTHEEAAAILSQSFKWAPGYIVIGITVDSTYDAIFRSLKIPAQKMQVPFMLRFREDEFHVILHDFPTAEFAIQVASEIRLSLLAETDATFSIGISRMRYKAGELYACRKEAQRACAAAYMFGQNSVIHIDYLDSNDIEYVYPKHKEQRLIEATMDGDTQTAFKMLDEIFEVLKNHSGLKQGLLNKMILEIVVKLNIAATSRVTVFEKMNLDSLALSKLLATKTADEAYTFIKQGIKDFAEEMDALSDVSREALFYKLMTLKEASKQVSISDLARTLGTTAGFINAAIYRNSGSNVFSFFNILT